ncbi:MAG TPA: tRNA (adenosine(37)-N6)-threonylcarbamoyltransferase complex dimerization subunit type 1 TsaB [Gammaproteobacteria bacterium]|nr:tRNA (adenosine(37)-N6)-threonylcarbamoyltransferase complex dimerization subunit type 1 TsaB [Gammaproteobacteria bacterium]
MHDGDAAAGAQETPAVTRDRSRGARGMRLLAIETSSAVGTVALACGIDIAEREIPTPREQTQRLLPLVEALMSEAGLRFADLDAIAFGRGPGSFTGLRIAAATAQGLALGADLPVAPVSSLQALAERAAREHGASCVLTCVDARMGEVYSALYERAAAPAALSAGPAAHSPGPVPLSPGAAALSPGPAPLSPPPADAAVAPMRLLGEERLGAPERLDVPAAGAWYAAGDGWARYRAELAALLVRAAGVGDALYPTAKDLLPQAAADVRAGNLLSPERALPVYLRAADAWRKTSEA